MADLDEVKDFLTKSLAGLKDQTQQALDQAINESKTLGTIVGKTADELKALGEKTADVQARLLALEQAGVKRAETEASRETKSVGEIVTSSEEYKSLSTRGRGDTGQISVGSLKTAIINATGSDQPLVESMRVPGIVTPAERALTIRSLIPTGTTASNLVEFARENVFTNNAGPQYSSPARENVAKNESGITFELDSAAVVTIAHWVPASRQVLSDAGMLQAYINSRLMYGLKLEEEDEILNGAGTGGNLDGLINQATSYNRGASGDTDLDTILKAFLQVSLSEYQADGIVLNPIDWTNILLLKDDLGRYIFGDPTGTRGAQVWGKSVVATQSITSGTFLAGAFGLAAQLWDREQATIRVTDSHSDYFVKNMVAILAEERLALTVFRPTAIVTGSF